MPKPMSMTSRPSAATAAFSSLMVAKTYGGSPLIRRNSIAPGYRRPPDRPRHARREARAAVPTPGPPRRPRPPPRASRARRTPPRWPRRRPARASTAWRPPPPCRPTGPPQVTSTPVATSAATRGGAHLPHVDRHRQRAGPAPPSRGGRRRSTPGCPGRGDAAATEARRPGARRRARRGCRRPRSPGPAEAGRRCRCRRSAGPAERSRPASTSTRTSSGSRPIRATRVPRCDGGGRRGQGPEQRARGEGRAPGCPMGQRWSKQKTPSMPRASAWRAASSAESASSRNCGRVTPTFTSAGPPGTAPGHAVDSTRAFSSRRAIDMMRLWARILMNPGRGTFISTSRW